MKHLTLVLILCLLSGCALIEGANRGLNKGSDKYTSQDPVTGKRTPNLVSEEQEIAWGTNTLSFTTSSYRQEGIPVDADKSKLGIIQKVFSNITAVCHRPNLPWEAHLSEDKNDNAWCAPGGKVMVLKGLFGGLVKENSEEELASVLAHEIGHACCRHTAERATWGSFSSRYNKGKLQQGVYSTIQEDEADRVGLLYMALAGYDPTVAPNIWLRAHEKYGSNPGDYTYDHSLSTDRAEKTAELSKIALKYYKGPGVKNEKYKEILSNNDLIKPVKSSDEYRGIEALMNIWAKNKEIREEEKWRKKQLKKQ